MFIRVQMMGQLRGLLDADDYELELPAAATVQDALQTIAAQAAAARLQLLTDQETIRPSLLLAVNDQAIAAAQAASMVLHERDQLTILPPISGG